MRPKADEAAEYYFRYINLVPDGDIVALLGRQRHETVGFWRSISDERAAHRYAPDKWSIRQVVGHVNDTERLFVSRAFWFARGFDTPLPSFDQNVAMAAAGFDSREWRDLIEEFDALRVATIAFFRGLPAAGWERRGTASGNPFSVRALAHLAVGHVLHHNAIIRERYIAAR